jgi:hypothetical protein
VSYRVLKQKYSQFPNQNQNFGYKNFSVQLFSMGPFWMINDHRKIPRALAGFEPPTPKAGA